MCTDSIERVLDALRQHEQDSDRGGIGYRVPRFVAAHGTGTDLVDVGNPYAFYRDLICGLVASRASRAGETMPANRPIDQTDVVYLSFLRTGAALDGRIGTALSQLAFLPHLSRLGVTVLVTLPTGTIGRANRKGTRGSPFAVADPFAVDPSLADPLLPDLDATTQYRALVQACAMAGIRCGSIVPAATLALDSPLIGRFPEITYWWDLPPGTPLRPVGHGHAASGSPDTVPGVGPAVTGRFALPPSARAVTRADVADASLWRSADGLTPATACPDVLAGDAGTYTWADVAGVRFGSQLVPELGPVSPQLTRRDRAVQVVALSIAWRAAVLGERVFWVDVAARIPPVALELASDLAEAWDERSTRLCTLLSSGDPAGDGRIATRHHLRMLADACRRSCPRHRSLPPGAAPEVHRRGAVQLPHCQPVARRGRRPVGVLRGTLHPRPADAADLDAAGGRQPGLVVRREIRILLLGGEHLEQHAADGERHALGGGLAVGVIQARGLDRCRDVGGAQAAHPHPGAGRRHL
jgi:hypothetical protein